MFIHLKRYAYYLGRRGNSHKCEELDFIGEKIR